MILLLPIVYLTAILWRHCPAQDVPLCNTDSNISKKVEKRCTNSLYSVLLALLISAVVCTYSSFSPRASRSMSLKVVVVVVLVVLVLVVTY